MSNSKALAITVLGGDEFAEAYVEWQIQSGRSQDDLGFIDYASDYVNFCIAEDSRSFSPTDFRD